MQEKFCLEYVATGDINCLESSRRKEGKTEADTRAESKRLLKNDKIEERCNQIRLDAMKDVSVNINEVVKNLWMFTIVVLQKMTQLMQNNGVYR